MAQQLRFERYQRAYYDQRMWLGNIAGRKALASSYQIYHIFFGSQYPQNIFSLPVWNLFQRSWLGYGGSGFIGEICHHVNYLIIVWENSIHNQILVSLCPNESTLSINYSYFPNILYTSIRTRQLLYGPPWRPEKALHFSCHNCYKYCY